ncbi:hypothetical protein [Fibrella aquatilis]|uniref:Uncharacterized protein n=1 Tax=Fibrella aquatilis TaxID=2817059 RepID=A0A939G779_9BACT|nr:hypothetical protein [Fibrella aquatilis]MBO0932488.1 hypothetical protein [Fibrella aquatilis]
MKLVYRFCCFLLLTIPAMAQQADSLRVSADTNAYLNATRSFNDRQGPAEHVFSLVNIPVFRFKEGVFRITDRAFPLVFSPDSLVSVPAKRANRQSRRGLFAGIASVVPLVVLSYSVVRLAAAPLVVVSGQTYQRDDPKPLIIVSGATAMVGVVVSATFNITSIVNTTRAIRRHNAQFGRRVPTLFNPKGL